jgi:hypothetical protein
MFDFLRGLIAFLEKQNIPYMLLGSVGMSLYTQPQFTRDYDFVVNLDRRSAKTPTIYQGKRCLVEGIERGKRDFKIETNQK